MFSCCSRNIGPLCSLSARSLQFIRSRLYPLTHGLFVTKRKISTEFAGPVCFCGGSIIFGALRCQRALLRPWLELIITVGIRCRRGHV